MVYCNTPTEGHQNIIGTTLRAMKENKTSSFTGYNITSHMRIPYVWLGIFLLNKYSLENSFTMDFVING